MEGKNKKMATRERRKEILNFLKRIVFPKIDMDMYRWIRDDYLMILYKNEDIYHYKLEQCLKKMFPNIKVELIRGTDVIWGH